MEKYESSFRQNGVWSSQFLFEDSQGEKEAKILYVRRKKNDTLYSKPRNTVGDVTSTVVLFLTFFKKWCDVSNANDKATKKRN